MSRGYLSLLCVVIGVFACGSESPVRLSNVEIRERSVSQEDPIQGGLIDTTSNNVVAILIGAGQGGICTGSLIAPNLVLTARHCVGGTPGNLGSCASTPFANSPYAADSFLITTSPSAAAAVFAGQTPWPTANNTTWFAGAQVLLPPTPGNTICGGDIALIRLSANIDNVCTLIPRVDSAVTTNEQYTAIGYGITSPGGQLAGVRYQVTGMTVLCSGNCNFDGISDTYEWVGGAQTQKGTCEGDSGGPALDALGRVTGALSRGSADACNLSVYSGVFGHADWLKAQTVEAAVVGGFAAPPWATGGATTWNPCFPSDAGLGGGNGSMGGGSGSAMGGGSGSAVGGGSGSPVGGGNGSAVGGGNGSVGSDDAGVDAGVEAPDAGTGGGVLSPPIGGGGGEPATSGCNCNTVDPSFVVLALMGLLVRGNGRWNRKHIHENERNAA